MSSDARAPKPNDDRIETLVRLAGHLGFNPMRTRWKLIRLEQRWQRWRHQAGQKALHVGYEHQTCVACGSVNDRAAARCSRCDEALIGRRTQVLERIGFVVPRFLSVSALLAVAMLAVYGREMLARPGGGYLSVDTDILLRFGALWPPLLENGEWWRLATAIFEHIGLWHLAFNLLALAQVGPMVESIFGRARMLFFFMATGVLASLGSWLLGVTAVSAGASGAIMGLTGVAAGWGQRDGTTIGRNVRNHMLRWGAYTMVFGYFIGANNAAHACGFVAGALLGLVTAPARQRQRTASSRWPGFVLGTAGALAATLSLALALFPPHPEKSLQDAAQNMALKALQQFVDEHADEHTDEQ